MISWAKRTRVRSISEADISCAFSRRLAGRGEVRGFMNAASYAGKRCGARQGRAGWGPVFPNLVLPNKDSLGGHYNRAALRVGLFCAAAPRPARRPDWRTPERLQ